MVLLHILFSFLHRTLYYQIISSWDIYGIINQSVSICHIILPIFIFSFTYLRKRRQKLTIRNRTYLTQEIRIVLGCSIFEKTSCFQCRYLLFFQVVKKLNIMFLRSICSFKLTEVIAIYTIAITDITNNTTTMKIPEKALFPFFFLSED